MNTSIEAKLADPSFDVLLKQLQDREIDYIEYGAQNNDKYAYLTCLRIRWISTMAGMQFAIKEVHGGIEGSGIYYQPEQALEMRLYLATRIAKYEEPNPLIERLRKDKGFTRTPRLLRFYGENK